MDYPLSEDEFNSLEGVRDQLGLIAGLAVGIDDEALVSVTAPQLSAFVGAQKGALDRVLKAVLHECQQRAVDRILDARKASAEPAAPYVTITPELLMGLMDAASGAVTDSDALLGLWDALYDAGVEHRKYMDVLHHFLDMLRGRGLVLRTEFQDGEAARSFVVAKPPSLPSAMKTRAPKPRKRERLASAEA